MKNDIDDDYYWDIKQHPCFCGESLNGSCKNSPIDIIKKIEKENNMTTYKKIEKWANENGYKMRVWNFNAKIALEKEEMIHETFATQCMVITLEYNRYKLLSIESFITHSRVTDNSQKLENLFIPLNNVKRDEKLLKEYLKND